MNGIQKHALRLGILFRLQQNGDYQIPEKALFIELNTILDGPVTDAELQDALSWLKEKGYIDFTKEEFSEVKRWRITEDGKARLPK